MRARRDFNAAVAELSRLQYENAVLSDTIRRLQHDAPTIENVARAELGLIKPGEILVVVKRSAAPVMSTAVTKTAATEETQDARDSRE